MDRVEELLKRMPLDYVEMGPGDALFFHPNLLHRSDRNHSDRPALGDDLLLQRRSE